MTNDDRVRELEAENARLRARLATVESKLKEEQRLLNTYILDTLPKTDDEMLQLLADSRPSEEVFAELEREFGPFPREGRA
jgi:septation ring formation regulator EzrA